MLEAENKLIRQAQEGNRGSFGQLYDHYLDKIYRYVFLKVGSKHEAEDLCHDVFFSAWQNIGGYEEAGHPFSSWLYQIARNKVIDFYRTRRKHSPLDDVDEQFIKVVNNLEARFDDLMEFGRVQRAMEFLSEEQKDVLLMRFVEDLSHREIAAALEKTEGAIRLIQHRALNSLRDILQNKEKEKENGG